MCVSFCLGLTPLLDFFLGSSLLYRLMCAGNKWYRVYRVFIYTDFGFMLSLIVGCTLSCLIVGPPKEFDLAPEISFRICRILCIEIAELTLLLRFSVTETIFPRDNLDSVCHIAVCVKSYVVCTYVYLYSKHLSLVKLRLK